MVPLPSTHQPLDHYKFMNTILKPNDLILFQGDSITDAGRSEARDGLGCGYVAMVRGLFQALHPDFPVRILNRGVSGDRTAELLARWQIDCLDLKPDVLSIMIGVNDVWRLKGEWNGQKHIALPEFSASLTRLLEQARAAGIRQLVLMSPTSIEPENDGELTQILGGYAAEVKRLAGVFGAVYVPAREAMLAARAALPNVIWTTDGCHPGVSGHALLAAAWLKAVTAG